MGVGLIGAGALMGGPLGAIAAVGGAALAYAVSHAIRPRKSLIRELGGNNYSKTQYTSHQSNSRNTGNNNQNPGREDTDDDTDDDDDTELSQSSSDDDTTDLSDVSDDEEEDSSDERDDRCEAITRRGMQCERVANSSMGACSIIHQQRVREQRGRFQLHQFDLPRWPFEQYLELSSRTRSGFDRHRRVNAYENPGWIYVYQLSNGDIKIGRTKQDNPTKRWSQQRRRYGPRTQVRAWWCQLHVHAETLILNLLDCYRRGRNEELNGNIISIEEVRELVRLVIKIIHKAMGDGDESTEPSTHYPDQ